MAKETQFVKHIRSHLSEYGFKLIFGRGKRVNIYKARCEGYFLLPKNKKDREIRVAKGGETWLFVLAHEYCHFLQWLDQSEVFSQKLNFAQEIANTICANEPNTKWTTRQIRWAFKMVANNERDCERKTVKLLEAWGIPFNRDMYIKKANLYVYLHHFWMEHQSAKSVFNVYKSNRILNVVPTTFKAKSHLVVPKTIDTELRRAFG